MSGVAQKPAEQTDEVLVHDARKDSPLYVDDSVRWFTDELPAAKPKKQKVSQQV